MIIFMTHGIKWVKGVGRSWEAHVALFRRSFLGFGIDVFELQLVGNLVWIGCRHIVCHTVGQRGRNIAFVDVMANRRDI